ncbi:hypothetical protein [Aliivibrio fischeri]|uniref:hypothetical protein n=1 Tax=Aliivibrio fischeri TaxID=668 RepID=UPI00064C05D1|nr:hypothetical protein [Aliivibrio fischeri]KLU80628.1 hypothetical protein AB192_02045 [Aliivibrio fischeri]MUK24974.1 hypothetical protein [Aliivibrio fischeri]MUK32604.1 hypothetical protein [Aliivibrio fischeri]
MNKKNKNDHLLKYLIKKENVPIDDLMEMTGKSKKRLQADIANLRNRTNPKYRIITTHNESNQLIYKCREINKKIHQQNLDLINLVFR